MLRAKPLKARTLGLLGLSLLGLPLILALQGQQESEAQAGSTSDDEQRAPHLRIDEPSSSACGGCHQQVWSEWSESLHARAWTNANIRRATNGFRKVQCRACHSPMPILPEGLDEPPDYRDFNQSDGVHCLSCHGLADGVAAGRSIPGAPCRPREEARMGQAELCWPCHQPTHGAFDEYYESQAFAQGKICADCHMPPREDGSGRFHGALGGFNQDFVKSALEWSAAIEGRELVLRLRNLTGHRFPGEISSRSLLIRVSFPGHEALKTLLRKPHRGEAREDDRLGTDELRVLRFPLPPGTSSATVELFFLPLPLLAPEQGLWIGSWAGKTQPSGD